VATLLPIKKKTHGQFHKCPFSIYSECIRTYVLVFVQDHHSWLVKLALITDFN
jgi:hypothetical protein